jgi:hypothetical protein
MMETMFRLVGFAAVATAIYVSCYRPSFRDCEISCTAQSGCPDGLSCDMGAGRCAIHGTCAPGDAPPNGSDDGGMPDASVACWTYAPTNYNPCAPGFPGAGTITTTMIDTSNAGCDYASGAVCLYHVTNLSITQPLHVVGPRPLIIVSDMDIDVEAPLSFDATIGVPSSKCTAVSANSATRLGAGAGGGGYGAPGAPGGTGSGVVAPAGGMAFGSESLEPLYPGCPGANGGSATNIDGGARGFGGGAIELSAKAEVHVGNAGVVSANGGGGDPGGFSGSNASGGGGGGTGGSVLLEGTYVDVAGMVCAVGGGGGEGGIVSTTISTPGGNGVGCTRGSGGAAGTGVGAGGNGGGSAAPVGGGNNGPNIAGGGGGGSVGRFRIHSVQTATTAGATTVPPPTM